MQKRRKQRRRDKPFRHTRSSIHIHLCHKLPRHALKRPGRIKKHHISKRLLEDTPEIEPNPHKRHHAVPNVVALLKHASYLIGSDGVSALTKLSKQAEFRRPTLSCF
ncbi:hypothetical protein BU17DRAFT_86111 [Hysterangium stoloniferum]|nr:hypothetical protein BU17DRAFT_86111 [Hysterangium stoloniferum]